MEIRACLFDVFGTVVDWRTSVSRDLAGFAKEKGIGGVDRARRAAAGGYVMLLEADLLDRV